MLQARTKELDNVFRNHRQDLLEHSSDGASSQECLAAEGEVSRAAVVSADGRKPPQGLTLRHRYSRLYPKLYPDCATSAHGVGDHVAWEA